MKDYSAMSDQQINAAVGLSFGEKFGESVNGLQIMNIDAQYLCSSFDPCNNPADAWPIIYGNGISIGIYGYGEWGAGTVNHDHVDGVNPLRSAMIVYLMMKDAEKGHG